MNNRVTLNVFSNGKKITVIKRRPVVKGFVGNFVPHWARYNNEIYLIKGGIDYEYMHGPKPEGMEYFIEI